MRGFEQALRGQGSNEVLVSLLSIAQGLTYPPPSRRTTSMGEGTDDAADDMVDDDGDDDNDGDDGDDNVVGVDGSLVLMRWQKRRRGQGRWEVPLWNRLRKDQP
jgi:hypothetical protein